MGHTMYRTHVPLSSGHENGGYPLGHDLTALQNTGSGLLVDGNGVFLVNFWLSLDILRVSCASVGVLKTCERAAVAWGFMGINCSVLD